MFFSEYLHEKAEESRHNETVGYFLIVIGSIFLIGGLLETVITVENPEWFLIIPYHLTPHAYSLLGLSLTTVGLVRARYDNLHRKRELARFSRILDVKIRPDMRIRRRFPELVKIFLNNILFRSHVPSSDFMNSLHLLHRYAAVRVSLDFQRHAFFPV